MPRAGTRTGRVRAPRPVPQPADATAHPVAPPGAEAGHDQTPLDYLLAVMRDESADRSVRFQAAKAAAPFVHPRLSSIEASLQATISHEDALSELE